MKRESSSSHHQGTGQAYIRIEGKMHYRRSLRVRGEPRALPPRQAGMVAESPRIQGQAVLRQGESQVD